MRVFYTSLIALLILLFSPLVAWGVAMTDDLGMSVFPFSSYLRGIIIRADDPALYAVDPIQPLQTENQPEDRKSVPISRDALPPTTATEILAAMQPKDQPSQPVGRRHTKLPPQVPQRLSHAEALGLYLRQYA